MHLKASWSIWDELLVHIGPYRSISVHTQQSATSSAKQEISTANKDTEEGAKLLPNIINAKNSELKDNETKQNTEEDLCAAYVTISTANS